MSAEILFLDLERSELDSVLSRAVEILFIDPEKAVLVVTPGGADDFMSQHKAYGLTCEADSHDEAMLRSVIIEGCLVSPYADLKGMVGTPVTFTLSGQDDLDGGALFAFISAAYKAYAEVVYQKI